jgi:hypothetical protein
MEAILLAGILTLSTQLTTILSIKNEINTTKYKDLSLTRCARKLLLSHHYRHFDKYMYSVVKLRALSETENCCRRRYRMKLSVVGEDAQ